MSVNRFEILDDAGKPRRKFVINASWVELERDVIFANEKMVLSPRF